MRLVLLTRWFELNISVDRPVSPPSEPTEVPRIQATGGGQFETDGQPDARELYHRPFGF